MQRLRMIAPGWKIKAHDAIVVPTAFSHFKSSSLSFE
jgi:hypothetical protein